MRSILHIISNYRASIQEAVCWLDLCIQKHWYGFHPVLPSLNILHHKSPSNEENKEKISVPLKRKVLLACETNGPFCSEELRREKKEV